MLAAFRQRRLTGLGLKIDLSQVESTLSPIGTGAVAVATDARVAYSRHLVEDDRQLAARG